MGKHERPEKAVVDPYGEDSGGIHGDLVEAMITTAGDLGSVEPSAARQMQQMDQAAKRLRNLVL